MGKSLRVSNVGQIVGSGITSSPSAAENDSGIWVSDENGGALNLIARRGSILATKTNLVMTSGGGFYRLFVP